MKQYRHVTVVVACVSLSLVLLLGAVAYPLVQDVQAAATSPQTQNARQGQAWPKSISAIAPRSQWASTRIVAPDTPEPPRVLLPIYPEIEGGPEPDALVYYVINHAGDESAFGTENGLAYWEGTSERVAGPFYYEEVPFNVDLPLQDFWAASPAPIDIHVLVAHDDIAAPLLHKDTTYRIYYELRSEPSEALNLVVTADEDADLDNNAVPDYLSHMAANAESWIGHAAGRRVMASTLAIAHAPRMPGQQEGTVRFAPITGTYLDIPTTAAFIEADIINEGDRIVGVVQVAHTFGDLVDYEERGNDADPWDTRPGEALAETPFVALHLFRDAALPTVVMSPIGETHPLSTLLAMYTSDTIAPDPKRQRLALWHYPLQLDAVSGRYQLPEQAAWSLAWADAVTLENNMLSAHIKQDGITVPLITELWIDSAVPTVLAADSEKLLPVVLRGIFPTWMGTTLEDGGVTPEEAATRYAVTLGDAVLSFRTPELEGIDAGHAITPVLDVQEPNLMYLWAPAALDASPNASIQVRYTPEDGADIPVQIPVMVKPTIQITAEAAPKTIDASITLEPAQSAVNTMTGEYPLEEGRYFTDDTITASVAADEGWGAARWLRNGVEVSQEPVYTFVPGTEEDIFLTAEIDSYQLTVSRAPEPTYGNVSLEPEPTVNAPGYAPGTVVTLRARPVGNRHFSHWEGRDVEDLEVNPEQTAEATLVMNGNKRIEAVFHQQRALNSSVSPEDSGVMYYDDGAGPIPLESAAPVFFDPETALRLTMEPQNDYHFREWVVNGTSAGTMNELDLLMDTDKTVVAHAGRFVQLTIVASALGDVEVVSPEPEPCEKDMAYCFWQNSTVTLHAEANEPEVHVLNAWYVDDSEAVSGAALNNEYTLTLTDDTRVQADFQRRVRIDGMNLETIPANRSVPLALTGVFPTWTTASRKAAEPLSPEEAEARYALTIGGAAASFLAPETSTLTPAGEGITWLDEEDVTATNMAYIWTPAEIPLSKEEEETVAVIIQDRINPLNTFEMAVPVSVFASVATVTVETVVPEEARGFVHRAPEQSAISTNVDGVIQPLESGDYFVGSVVELTAVPAHTFTRYRITTDEGVSRVEEATHQLTITDNTHIDAIFSAGAYQLQLIPSEGGVIEATPPNSPGLPPGWYVQDAEVTLEALPGVEQRFTGWTHDLAGSFMNPVMIAMDEDKQAGALFLSGQQVTLAIIPSDGGTVDVTPTGDGAPTRPDIQVYEVGDTVTLTAKTESGYRFDSWRISGTGDEIYDRDNPLTLTLDRDYIVTPVYVQVFNIQATATPPEGGTILITPAPTSLGYDIGAEVTLEALPETEDDYRFVGWTGNNATDVMPNSTTPKVTVIMDSDKEVTANFARMSVDSVYPPEAWIFGGVIARINGTAFTEDTLVYIGGVEVAPFDVAPSGNALFVQIPPLDDASDTDTIRVSLEVVQDSTVLPYTPGFTYKRRSTKGGIYTAAFIADKAGEATPVFAGRINEQTATVTVPPLGEAPVYGIVRIGASGALAAGAHDDMPGTSMNGLYDLGIHLFAPPSNPNRPLQYGVMVYEDVTNRLLAFKRPFAEDATHAMSDNALRMHLPVNPQAAPDYASLRDGISIWGVSSKYDYLTEVEAPVNSIPVYQSLLLGNEALPANEPNTPPTETLTGIAGARAYGAMNDAPANCFTWRQGAIVPDEAHRFIQIAAVNNLPAPGTASGAIRGGTAIRLISPYGGLAWIDSIELVGTGRNVGGTVAVDERISVLGEDEFVLEFRTPESGRPGVASIILHPKADPTQEIRLEKVFEYTRAPIRWWLILLIMLGIALSIIGLATAD